MAAHALIHILEAARAAQYAALVEPYNLSATHVRTIEEALFHLRRLGPATLILVEVHLEGGGFTMLRRLRAERQAAPAVVFSGSWLLRNEAQRLRRKLNIAEVLAPSQHIGTVEKAIARALRAAAPRLAARESKEGPRAPAFPPTVTRKRSATATPASHAIEGSLEAALESACGALRASMALAWFDEGADLRGHFGWDASIVSMVGTPEDWAPFRRLCSAPVFVADAAKDKVLSRSALVTTGMVASFAGAPLVDSSGVVSGALWVAHREASALLPDVLEPLTVWAQSIGARFAPSVRPESPPTVPPPPSAPERQVSRLQPALAAEQAALALAAGLIVTDATDRVAFSNPAALEILGLQHRRLTGLSRARLIDELRLSRRIDNSTAARITNAGPPARLEVRLRGPDKVLRWDVRLLSAEQQTGVIDEITDASAEAATGRELDRLIRIDSLTWLGNWRSFDEALAAEMARALRFRAPLSLAVFLVDGRGAMRKEVAERALRDVAWLIADIKRGYDSAARINQDTLAVILPGADAAAALLIGKRIVSEAADLSSPGLPRITVSAGVAGFDSREDVHGLLARASGAALEAEACGGNGIL